MAFDGLVVAALTYELRSQIMNGRIDKIYQPEADEIILTVRSGGKNNKILLSSNSNYPKIHFTNSIKENPTTPPNFCMVLRKHLLGGRIIDVIQPQFERMIKLVVESFDELNILKCKELIIEIMGKHSNIILIDCETNKVVDSVKRISFDVSRYRQILPGLEYSMPPSKNKINPLEINNKDRFYSIIKNNDQRISVQKSIYTSFTGVSPLISREICYRSSIDENMILSNLDEDNGAEIYNAFSSVFNPIKTNTFNPSIYYDVSSGRYIDFSSIPIRHLNNYYKEENLQSSSEMIETFYLKRDTKERMKQRTNDLRKSVSIKLDRLYNKLSNLNKDLKNAHESKKYKLYGDLITANIYQISKGEENVELINYHDENYNKISIPLDKRLTPAQNAQRCFKLYTKSKTALSKLHDQIEKTEEEVHYLEQIMISIDQCTHLSDIEEIRAELEETGFIKRKITRKNINSNHKKSNYLKYISSEGLEIFVGKNNKQNDEITFKLSSKDNLWFHVKDMPGSHVILKQEDNIPGNQSILEAATLAAYYSKGKNSTKVAVDYTERKNVKKQSGAKPGMVIYDNYSTILVDSDDQSISGILKSDF